jgi:hypothetical protein
MSIYDNRIKHLTTEIELETERIKKQVHKKNWKEVKRKAEYLETITKDLKSYKHLREIKEV